MSILEVTVVCSPMLFTEDSYACIVYGHTKASTRICTDGGKQKFEFPLIDGFREFDIAVCSHEDGLIARGKVWLGRDISMGYDDILCPVHNQAGELAGEVRLITHFDESFGQESRKGNYQEVAAVMSLPSFSRHIPQLFQTFKDWKLLPPTSFKCAHCSSTALVGPNCCDTCGHKWETDKEDFFDVIDMGMLSNSGLLASVLNHNRAMSLQCLCGLIIKDGFPVRLVGMEYDDSGGGQAADHQMDQEPETGYNNASTPVGGTILANDGSSPKKVFSASPVNTLYPYQSGSWNLFQSSMGDSSNSQDPTELDQSSLANFCSVSNIPGDGGGLQVTDLEAYDDESIKQKAGVGMLPQNKEDVRIKMPIDENTAEQLQLLCDVMKQLVEDKKKTDTLNILSTMVLASSAQGAASLISAGSSAVPWIIAAANAVTFTASLTSICLVGKKPPVSILLSKFGTAALVTVVMGVTYMYLPVYLKWLASLGCTIPIAAVIYS